jgi:hypothetical protein
MAMRDFAKVSPQIHIGKTGRQLRGEKEAQILYFYLVTSPHSNMLGIFYNPIEIIALETGIPLEGASKGLRRVEEVGFCTYDPLSGYVWVHEMARFQIGEKLKPTDNRVKGIKKELASLPNLPFLNAFIKKYEVDFHLKNEEKNISPFEAPSKPLRSQETETETENIKDTLDKSNLSAVKDIFEYWQKTHNHPKAVFSKDRIRLIRKSLKSYTSADLKLAILGCSLSDFHMGRDGKNSTVHDDIELILRKPKQIETFIALAGDGDRNKVTSRVEF